jgi:DedD protein
VARSETVPARDAQGLPEAWSVRLGVFADRANAEALEARLLTAGHKAYLQPVRTGQGSMSGVFVGPVLTKREADALQQQLAAAFPQEPGIVQQFRIEP